MLSEYPTLLRTLLNHEYMPPDFRTMGLIHSHTRREFFWETARVRLYRLSQSFLMLVSSRE